MNRRTPDRDCVLEFYVGLEKCEIVRLIRGNDPQINGALARKASVHGTYAAVNDVTVSYDITID